MGWIVTIVIGRHHRLARQHRHEDERADGHHRQRPGWHRGIGARILARGLLGVPATSAVVGYIISIVGAVILIAILKALGIFK